MQLEKASSPHWKSGVFHRAHMRLRHLELIDAGYLAGLIGYKNYQDYRKNCVPRDIEVLRMLAGPHAMAIYKALKAREND